MGISRAAQDDASLNIAKTFLAANAELLGLEPDLLGLRHQKTLESLGARHVLLQQFFQNDPVHRGYVTVHISNDGQVYMVKNRAMPRSMLPKQAKFEISKAEAVRRARLALPKHQRASTLLELRRRWFPKGRRLTPSWRVRLARRRPREEWIVYINGQTGGVLRRYDNLARADGRGSVFDPSPVTALGDHTALLSEDGNPRRPPIEAYSTVTLHDLKTNGRLDGKRVTTSPTRPDRRVHRSDRNFVCRSTDKGFEEVMVYYHIDQAIRYLEALGYHGKRAIFDRPVGVNVNGTRQDNSWYSPAKRLLTFGIGAIDDAEDAETILHEFGHAIQDAIVPDFGQSTEAAAMGEGFGDYFAASFFADKKPERYRTTVMTWDGLFIGLKERSDPPGLRRVDEPVTYDDFGPRRDEHNNGKIWSATLWDVREKLGREAADRLILESHFQLDGFTTFARSTCDSRRRSEP